MTDPVVLTPTPGSPINSSTVTFTWADNGTAGITAWAIYGGSTGGGTEFFHKTYLVGVLSYTAINMPTNGSEFYFRLHWQIGGAWHYQDIIYPIGSSGGTGPYVVPEYKEWLLDTRNTNFRVLLITLKHSTGAIYSASQPWNSDTHQAYDDNLISEPMIEDSLEDFLSVGDVDLVELEPSEDWLSKDWRGFECFWDYGDIRWNLADFKRLATVLIDGCRAIDGNKYRFDLLDNGQTLRKTWPVVRTNWDISARSTMDRIMVEAGRPAMIYTNVPESTRSWSINIDVDNDTILANVIRTISRSVNAYMRVRQNGQIECFIPDLTLAPEITLTADDIVYGSVNMTELIHPYSTVTVQLYDDSEVSESTGAQTGALDEEHIRSTVLSNAANAQTLANEDKLYHEKSHAVWSMGIMSVADDLQIGDHIGIDHPELVATGLLSRIRRSPISDYTLIEVTV